VNVIRRHDKSSDIHYVSLQSEKRKKLQSNLNTDFMETDTVIFEQAGKTFIRSEAVIECLSFIGGFWKLTKFFRIIPLRLRDAIYDIVAKNRYKWFGRRNSCEI
jgi:predicted DCC family thiol-disulfide oxidoreductase YuxK